MKYLTTFVCCFVVFLQTIYAQETIKTQVKAIDVIALFSKGNDVLWEVPVSQSEKLLLRWNEQETSFTKKEGIRTFVSFQEGELVGILSINKTTVSGEVTYKHERIQLVTNSEGFLEIASEHKHECGTCKNGTCMPSKTGRPAARSGKTAASENKVANRDVLFTYRLALPVSYISFSDYSRVFKGSVENVKSFWANAEVQLNAFFMRELGIRFEVINDEKLIITDSNTDFFKANTAEGMIGRATLDLDKLIGNENYDLGMVMTTNMKIGGNRVGSAGGLAYFDGAYNVLKGGSMAVPVLDVIAHEMGHMFGSSHTFTTGGDYTYFTETNRGQSVMSYGDESGDFFSLVSLHFIRQKMAKLHYYEDRERTKLVKDSVFNNYVNFPFGEKIPNQPPVIDRSKLKKSYDLPKYTYFQFQINATDPDDAKLTYMAHQADIHKKNQAKFITLKGTEHNVISFQPLYVDTGAFNPDAKPVKDGTYTFWLGVSDGNSQKKRPVMYDVFETQVNLKEGKTFEITSSTKDVYQVGESVTLKWAVDNNFFDRNSKVRILLSDDLGKTYKHVIAEQTENDGEHTFTIPNVLVGVTTFGKGKKVNLPAGVFKVEVLDHIAYAITNVTPYKITNNARIPYGGFKIIPADGNSLLPLQFVGVLPQNETVTCAKAIPEKQTLSVEGGCNPSVKVTETIKNQTCANNYVLERTYTASDNCGSTPITHVQLITVSDDEKPKFVGELPANMTVKKGEALPQQKELTATDNCTENLTVVKSQHTLQENGNEVVIYKWEVTDACGNKTEHTQKIIVTTSHLAFTEKLPQNAGVSCEGEIPPAPKNLSVSGDCNPKVSFKETKSNESCFYTITRVWTASDDCGNSISHTQLITVSDTEKPEFTGELPKDISVEEGKIPAQTDLLATDNCTKSLRIVKDSDEITENGQKVIVYKWTATDACGNASEYIQKITVLQKKPDLSLPPTDTEPQLQKEMVIYNGVSTENGSENYLKIEPIEAYKNLHIEIFNELGQKVFQAKDYQRKGGIFRGYANVNGVVGKGKRLPTGTYFYILKYQDQHGNHFTKQGYVFVR
ncbi:reprolysin-like metallopeptidase [Capnocytophaga sp.]|uniref:reprolysin-like metallopeptidase n=1 Tax=Capnocytophaga sp. TaxID=44737 RepID=UPI0026DA6EB0|nr:gliding motility-associated C-terminal domain-containing protein [Capnocytophaga sp.]MDO5105037.1 gliding motility-associated C-terminal domain-containing protein [Capnocytophaga sp.]